jgi:hypothetical protein
MPLVHLETNEIKGDQTFLVDDRAFPRLLVDLPWRPGLQPEVARRKINSPSSVSLQEQHAVQNHNDEKLEVNGSTLFETDSEFRTKKLALANSSWVLKLGSTIALHDQDRTMHRTPSSLEWSSPFSKGWWKWKSLQSARLVTPEVSLY